MPDAYWALRQHKQPVAIIGAGVAGLTAARLLSPRIPTVLYDAAASVGGRLATRRCDGHAFDHGAQFFKPRHPRFAAEVRRLVDQGVVAPWIARFAEFRGGTIASRRQWTSESAHYVGIGGMGALAASWATGLDLRLSRRVTGLRSALDGTWLTLDSDGEQGPFGLVILALPAPGAHALLPADCPLRSVTARARMKSCYALMLGLDGDLDLGFDAALVKDAPLSWISVTGSRPGHQGPSGIVALAANAWADANRDRPPADIQAALLAALSDLCERPFHASVTTLHHWPSANSDPVRADGPQIDPDHRIALCGDWLRQGRVEAAFLSGAQIADTIIAAMVTKG
ncbi:NAD(P)/FAD-dependent oxidoreductase [Niveispirillum lacus]|uniref:NAD(P)/FAD-dependent oxidoreductase n=1 Tax=Niveispirillum lacus TaxID=1981099 RepID=UPI0013FD1AD5|nr:FAD-dependent oxidoreductase [Niveispirillum lacus]